MNSIAPVQSQIQNDYNLATKSESSESPITKSDEIEDFFSWKNPKISQKTQNKISLNQIKSRQNSTASNQRFFGSHNLSQELRKLQIPKETNVENQENNLLKRSSSNISDNSTDDQKLDFIKEQNKVDLLDSSLSDDVFENENITSSVNEKCDDGLSDFDLKNFASRSNSKLLKSTINVKIDNRSSTSSKDFKTSIDCDQMKRTITDFQSKINYPIETNMHSRNKNFNSPNKTGGKKNKETLRIQIKF